MTRMRRARWTPQSMVGLGIITFGVLWLLAVMGVIRVESVWNYWPVSFIIVGVGQLVSGGRRALVPSLFWIALGLFLLDLQLGLFDFELLKLAPVLLICLGLLILWRSWRLLPGPQGVPVEGDADCVAIFAGVDRTISSPRFPGARLTAIFGGCDVDLRQSEIEGEAVIEVLAFFGGINITVPEHWTIIDRGMAVFGSFEVDVEHHEASGGDVAASRPSPRLVIQGQAVFGGVIVGNTPRDPRRRLARERRDALHRGRGPGPGNPSGTN